MADCIFCMIADSQLDSKKVYEDELAVAFLDINPLHRGHTVVIPRRHVVSLVEDPTVWNDVSDAMAAVTALVAARLPAQGQNVLVNSGEVAGQEVGHVHFHVIPRYSDNPGMAGMLRRDADAADLEAVLAELRD